MRSFLTAAALGGLVSYSNAHSAAGRLLVNHTDTGLWNHILEVAGADYAHGTVRYDIIAPQVSEDLGGSNITCGRNAFNSSTKTKIADVVAGDEIGFRLMTDADLGYPPSDNRIDYFWHPGIGQVYLSRALNDDLMSYRGTGDWFKVAYTGPRNDYEWELHRRNLTPLIHEYNFTLPRTTPPGKYLMRFEFVFPNVNKGQEQYYVNCAFVNIMGPGGGTPTEFARFPGTYNSSDLGMWIPLNQDMYAVSNRQLRLMEYKPPGPPVWKG